MPSSAHTIDAQPCFVLSIPKAAARALPRYRMLPASKQPTRHDSLAMSPFVGVRHGIYEDVLGCLPHARAFGCDNSGRAPRPRGKKGKTRPELAWNYAYAGDISNWPKRLLSSGRNGEV